MFKNIYKMLKEWSPQSGQLAKQAVHLDIVGPKPLA